LLGGQEKSLSYQQKSHGKKLPQSVILSVVESDDSDGVTLIQPFFTGNTEKVDNKKH
jgi:hypothetical protein